jgi:hypothetical protein
LLLKLLGYFLIFIGIFNTLKTPHILAFLTPLKCPCFCLQDKNRIFIGIFNTFAMPTLFCRIKTAIPSSPLAEDQCSEPGGGQQQLFRLDDHHSAFSAAGSNGIGGDEQLKQQQQQQPLESTSGLSGGQENCGNFEAKIGGKNRGKKIRQN